jgi:hypothetical protein
MKLSPRYGSHLPVLIQALARTHGPVLELGMGAYSTPILHAVCSLEWRSLFSVDNDKRLDDWAMNVEDYYCDFHKISWVDDWDKALIDYEWDVALVDHSPPERRVVEIRRLANLAQYIIIHDSNGRYERQYHYSTIYPLFKYKLDFTALEPSTTVLSNFHDLTNFWGQTWSKTISF